MTGRALREFQLTLGLTLTPGRIDLGGVNIGDFALGKLDLHVNPQVFEALGIVGREELSREYILCRGEKQGFIRTGQQREHVRSKLQFVSTKPTPEQYAQWEKDHPFPKE